MRLARLVKVEFVSSATLIVEIMQNKHRNRDNSYKNLICLKTCLQEAGHVARLQSTEKEQKEK